jgi:CTP:molybdopterin cytidylyltransferase MocA
MVTGIVLAAGLGSRLGQVKPLARLGDAPLLEHSVRRAGEAGLDEIILVLGHAAEQVRAGVVLPPQVRVVVNPDYASGQASSLRAGLAAAAPESRAAVVLLGDQPDMPLDAIREVVRIHATTGARAIRARYGQKPGHPVLLDRSVWAAVSAETGDRGAGPTLDRHPEWVTWVTIAGPPPSEVDSPEDLERVRRLWDEVR